MSNKVKQIDLLNRPSLILLGKKLELPGHTNNFTKPYRNMEYLKLAIQEEIKRKKKNMKNRRNSLNDCPQSSNFTNMNGGYGGSYGSSKMRRSKSLSSLNTNTLFDNNVQSLNLDVECESCIFPPQQKIVAIGDIHGDFTII